MTSSPHGPLRVGIGGPVGSGKDGADASRSANACAPTYDIAAITNDIYTTGGTNGS